jgi:hypothetical protein
MSRPCRTFVENATPAGTLWAIIMPPPNGALADPSLPLYSALSLSLPLLSPPLSSSSSWIARLTTHAIIPYPCLASEPYSPVSYLGNASSFSRKLIYYPTRSSLVYHRRQKLSSATHPYALFQRMCIHPTLSSSPNPESNHRVNCRTRSRSAHYPAQVTILAQQASRGPLTDD